MTLILLSIPLAFFVLILACLMLGKRREADPPRDWK